MRASWLSFVVVAFFVQACRGGPSPSEDRGAATSPSSPDSGDASVPPEGETAVATSPEEAICAEYIACIARKAPETLDVVVDAYGRSGSCWTEMSAEQCADACAAGKAKAQCDVCDPSSPSCLGEPCAANKRCARDEVCAKGACVEEAFRQCTGAADCPAPYQCTGAGDGFACLLTCAKDDDCPAGSPCDESYGFCSML